MKGHLQMSEKERRRLGVLERVVRKEITLATAAQQLQVSYRQAVRVLKRFRDEGDAGLAHAARGHPSPRQIDASYKDAVLGLYREKYADFGPTLASEKLAERDKKPVHRETLRLWLISAGCWQPRQSKTRHRTWRKRKACFGEMLQMDGSPHAWFEDRAERCFLMNLVDDATSAAQALFAPEETTWAATITRDLLALWVRLYGIPASLYVDRKNVYVTDREQTPAEQLAAMPALTQFGRACYKLGIRIIQAHSPQAKGRVERKHGVFQDRLIKEMRLEGIAGIDAANRFLPAWLLSNNDRFAVPPRSDADLHRPVPRDLDLRTVFCLEQTRSLGTDFTVRYDNRWLQVPDQKALPAPHTKITVQEWRDGTLHLYHKGRELTCRLLDERPQMVAPKVRPEQPRPVTVPPEDHPWRKPRKPDMDYIDPRHVPELVNQLADTYLGSPGFAT